MCVCLGLPCRAGELWNLSELSSHIEVIERLICKAVTWTPSREAHVAGLEPGEPRTAHICSSAYVTPRPSSQSQENTQAGPAGPRSVVAHAMRRTARASWPGLWTVRKSSALCRLWQPLPMALGPGSESWRQGCPTVSRAGCGSPGVRARWVFSLPAVGQRTVCTMWHEGAGPSGRPRAGTGPRKAFGSR